MLCCRHMWPVRRWSEMSMSCVLVVSSLKVTRLLHLLLLLLAASCCVEGGADSVLPGRTLAVANFNCDQDLDLVQLVNEATIKVRCLKAGYDGDCSADLGKWEFAVRSPGNVLGAAVSSFNGDAYPDILIAEKSGNAALVSAYIQWGSSEGFNKLSPVGDFIGQPTVLDCNNDGFMDILGIQKVAGQNDTWVCYLGSWDRGIEPNATVVFTTAPDFGGLPDYPLVYTSLEVTRLPQLYVAVEGSSNRSFGGFRGWIPSRPVFMEGTSIPDPFVKAAGGHRLFNVKERKSEDLSWGFPCIDDFNLDGNVDILIPALDINEPEHMLLYIYESAYGWSEVASPFGKVESMIDLKKGIDDGRRVRARSADIDHDGYPDLVVVLDTTSQTDVVYPKFEGPTGEPRAFLMMNRPCRPECNKHPGIQFNFQFLPLLRQVQLKGAVAEAAFVDVLSDSLNLNVLLVDETTNPNGSKAYTVQSVALSGTQTASFLVAEAYIPGNCSSKSSMCKSTSALGSGVAMPGACFDYTSKDNNGTDRKGAGCLLPMSSHTPLSMPTFMAGLSDTFNFVRRLRLTVPQNPTGSAPYKGISGSKEQLIPNSRIFVVPCPLADPGDWTWRNFVTPSHLVMMSFAAMSMVCGVIIIVIIIFHVHEKRQDQKERLAQTHRFHFNAL